MKISTKDIGQFLKKPLDNIKLFLLYGPDQGLAVERQKQLSSFFSNNLDDPFSITRIESTALTNDKTLLYDSINTLSILQKYRIVFVNGSGSEMLNSIKMIISNLNPKTKIFLLANDINSRHALVKLCETSNDCASIGCYHDNNMSLVNIINEIFERDNISSSIETKNYIASKVGLDRKISVSEIEKIALATGKDNVLELNDAKKFLDDNSLVEIDSLLLAILNGDSKSFYSFFLILKQQEVSPITIIKRTSFLFKCLEQLILYEKKGIYHNISLTKIAPYIHFKIKDLLIKKKNKWSIDTCRNLSDKLFQTEFKLKSMSMINSYTLLSQTLVSICFKSKN